MIKDKKLLQNTWKSSCSSNCSSKKWIKLILELNSDHGGRANSWHTDVTFEAAYPKFSILRGVEIPEAGAIPFGQTQQLLMKTYQSNYEISLINYGHFIPMILIMHQSVIMSLLKMKNTIKSIYFHSI